MYFVNPMWIKRSAVTKRPLRRLQARGFALVVTISLMVLLSLLAVGLLSLSTVSLRGSSNATDAAEARANARLALVMAIAELQRYTGADTRVTASAGIINESYPALLGVWRSWEGSNHESNGRPIVPDYASKEESESDGGRFLQWMVSSAVNADAPSLEDATSFVAMQAGEDTVPLLAEGSLPKADRRQIHVTPTDLGDGGRIAWWVSGENQKARLSQPYQPRRNDSSGLVEMGQSYSIPDPAVFGMEDLAGDPEPHDPNAAAAKGARKTVTRKSMALVQEGNAVEPDLRFHDFSTRSVGLLTNTATGGWRKDMSLLTERWDSIYQRYPGRRLPLFRFEPEAGATSLVPKPTTSNYDPAQSNLYPWSDYSLILGFKQPGTYHAASASWASLQSFATSYKNFTFDRGSITSPFVWDKIAKQDERSVNSSEFYNHKHKQRLHPQIARFQMLVYAKAFQKQDRPDRYELRLMYVPFFTLWNPHNVTIEHEISGTLNAGQGSGAHGNFLGFGWRRALPGAMAIVNPASYLSQGLGPDSVPGSQYRLLSNGNFQTLDWPRNYANPYDNELQENQTKFGGRSVWRDLRTWGCWLPEGTLTFKPGEAKIFSTEPRDTGYAFGGGAFRLREGYNPTQVSGNDFRVMDNLTADRSFWFLFRNDRVTQPYRDREPGYGFSLSFGDGSSHFGGSSTVPSGIGEEFHNITSLATVNEGDKYWPPDEVDEVTYSVAELASGPWIPIFSMSFGPRTTIGTGPGTTQNRPTKGLVQNNPLAAMVLSEPGSGDSKDHPANNTFDFAYHSLSLGSTITPNLSDSEAFIATGYQRGDGLSRLVMSEIPLRPMASLIELQSWNPRGQNPYPPLQMNLIGNSDATPLIPSSSVVPPVLKPSGVANNLMHDDAYCANHLLFDDWFLSSIAPLPAPLGGSEEKGITSFYQDYLAGEEQLANRAYQRIAEDRGLSTAMISDLTKDIIESPDGWLKVASRLEVDGMFNVNSTSVEAWKALLRHAGSRDRLAMHGRDRIIGIDAPSDGVFVTRGAVAGDVEAGERKAFGGSFANASEYTGFRGLSDEQLEDLAEKVVEQVRLRGPFLSLSEFVNRQLSNDKNLALAGAIQTALNNLGEDPMEELRDPVNSLSDDTMDPSDPLLDGADYVFEEAAEGSSAHGVPGWIRQADILRPIAPVLSARDDTFTIRAYGEHVDESGEVTARAWCEAVVKRTRDFCDELDSPDLIDPPASDISKEFGRRYQMISFRWLNSEEI